MLFNSFEFIIFATVVVFLYFSFKSLSIQNWILLIASFVFYSYWSVSTFIFLFVSLIINYIFSSLIVAGNHRKSFLTIIILYDVLFLSFFKYLNFYIDSINSIVSFLNAGGDPLFSNVEVTLPPGISFYTFQMMAYAIDVYRNNYRYCSNFKEFALFISFFPQLVAGPIIRASQIVYQIKKRDVINLEEFSNGLILVVIGLIQKILIADSLAPYVNKIYTNTSLYGSSEIILATYAFSLQIYFDFAGYSTIAIGLGRIFCLTIPQNFNNPYFAENISDFWHRWNMTLSAWIRDYIYIPLGGNRISEGRTYFNLVITMAVCGLWHGAAWNFVIWGIYHGILLALHRFVKNSFAFEFEYQRYLNVVGTFILVNIGWILFRAGSLSDIESIFIKLFSLNNLNATIETLMILALLHFVATTIYVILNKEYDTSLAIKRYLQLPLFLKVGINICVFYLIVIFLSGERVGFIYFRF